MREVRPALRFLAKKPGWTAAAVLTVAIGIAGSTLAFSLVDRALWRPLGFDDGGELVTLYARSGAEYSTISWRDYIALRDVLLDRGYGLTDLAAFVRTFSTVGGGEFPELHEGELVSGNFFSVLRVQPFLGRTVTASDNVTPGAHPVVVLSHMLWRTQFASDPDVLGRSVLLDGRGYEVIGVAPPAFRGPVWPSFESAFWIPAMMAADEFGTDEYRVFESAGLPVFQTVGRASGGARTEALQARIDPLDEMLARGRVDSPYFTDTGQDWRVAVLPGNYLRLWPEYREPVARVLLVLGLMAAAGLLVGCAKPGDAAPRARRRAAPRAGHPPGARGRRPRSRAPRGGGGAAAGGGRRRGCGRAGLRAESPGAAAAARGALRARPQPGSTRAGLRRRRRGAGRDPLRGVAAGPGASRPQRARGG